jgi:5S rRNA maturation endonuclease (ribonuclease M5)
LIVGFVSLQKLVGVQVDGGTEGSKVPPSREMVMNIVNFGNKKQPMSSRELVDLISERVPAQKQIDILRDTYPNGVMRGNLFTIGSLHGEPGKSLKIDINPRSPYFMKGQDFNGSDGVGGIVKIMMEGRGMKLSEIKEYFEDYVSDTRPVDESLQPVINTELKEQININTPFDSEHRYLNAHGEILCLVRRYNTVDQEGNPVLDGHGKPKKEFRQFTGQSTYPRMPDVRPLYNIPNILASDKIIWVEGEKCADALNDLGYTATCTMGGAGMLSRKSANLFDFSPLQDKELIIWPDNDSAGKKVAELVQDLAMNANAKSVTMLTPPRGKPERWDVVDAIAEQFNINEFLNTNIKQVKKNINLLDESLLVNRFVGQAPEQKFLIGETLPLGVPIIFSAAGDAGKGMMTLDLAMKVSNGKSMSTAFGGLINEYGNTIIFTAEDDEDEMHRRVERLDMDNHRNNFEHELRIVSLPNVGGVFPIMQETHEGYRTSDEFDKLYEQIKQMTNLKLIVFDPLASFVHADVNADPAAGAALTGLLAQIATETGASVIMCHHMTKIKEDLVVSSPEQARNMIRGTSALVDGVRCAFALWQVDEATGRRRCQDLGIDYQRNRCFDGAVVKSNGPANRAIRHFIRDMHSGLLVDRSDDIQRLHSGTNREIKKTALYNWIINCEDQGRAMTQQSGADALLQRMMSDADAPKVLNNSTQRILDGLVRDLIQEGMIAKYSFSVSGGRKWLGACDGPMSRGEYEASTARDNV